ncbi:MAG: hypothetical protein JWN70_931 [Planctomycetaceae bacterium]|nr:hypothetical protein [Planctomycetaceae bacterium]
MFHHYLKSHVALLIFVACFANAGGVCVGGDPFYYSTWYSQPSPALSWASASVMPGDRFGPVYSGALPANFDSPLFYQPGYGYVTPASPFRSTLRYYGQGYAYGGLSYGTRPGAFLNPGSGIGGYSSIGIQNRFGGVNTLGMLHPPYYLPGSPGNDREFLFRW